MPGARPAANLLPAHQPPEQGGFLHAEAGGDGRDEGRFAPGAVPPEGLLKIEPERHDLHGVIEARLPFRRSTIGSLDPSESGPIPDPLGPNRAGIVFRLVHASPPVAPYQATCPVLAGVFSRRRGPPAPRASGHSPPAPLGSVRSTLGRPSPRHPRPGEG